MAEFPELNDLDFLAADFELIDNTNGADLELFAIMSENTSRILLEEVNNTVSEKTEDQRNAPTFIEIKSNFIENMKNKNTVRKTQSAVKQFTTWLQMSPRFETREINKIPPGELNNFVGSFLLSIRKADGSEYEPDTLTSYHR